MYKRIWKPAAVVVVALALVLIPGIVLAETPAGEGPFDAMAPTGKWMELNEGEYDWYVIHFDYDAEEPIEPLKIRMFAEPYASASLTVRNQAQVDEWIRDGTSPHFGCCTMVDKDVDHDGKFDFAQWAGSLRESGDYYLVVEHAKDVVGPATYRFTVEGDNISYPTMAKIPAQAPMPVPKAEVPAQIMAPVSLQGMAGSAPDFALPPTGAWTELGPGQYHWYVFDFDFDSEVTQPVTIRLYADPQEGATLSVRNAEQAQLWKDEGEHKHFGCCSMIDVDKDGNGEADYALWEGSLRESGRYFIVAELAEGKTAPAYYRFTISGENLSFPQLNAAPMALGTPENMQEMEAPQTIAEPMAEAMPTQDWAGTGPDFALALDDEWQSLDADGYRWYRFNFDADEDWQEPVKVRFYTEPADAAILTIRNGHQAELWRQDGTHKHFGCCVPQEVTKKAVNDEGEEEYGASTTTETLDYAFWSAELTESGVYYLVVEHAKNLSEPALYRVELSGDGVTF